MEEDESQKTFDATQQKLDEARKKGDVPKSADVASVLILAAATLVFLVFGGKMANDLVAYCRIFLERPHEIAMDGGALTRLAFDISINMGFALMALFGAISFAAIAGHAGQTGLMYTTEKLIPKTEKIDPIKGFKRVFGKDAMVQFLKILFKLTVLCVVTYYVLLPSAKKAELMTGLDTKAIGPLLAQITKELLIKLLIVLVVFAIADYFIQRMQFFNRNKMSKQEMKDEHRQSQGDPMVAAKLRQIRHQKGRQRMMQKVPDATVIITNPTHFAVALKYVPGETMAPICLAKGVDAVAFKIREIGKENNVPIIEDPPLARALWRNVEIDDPIPTEHYQAVAKIIGAILSVAAKSKSRQTNLVSTN